MNVKNRTRFRRCAVARVRMLQRCIAAKVRTILYAKPTPLLALLASVALNVLLGTLIVESVRDDEMQKVSMIVPKIPEMIAASVQGLSQKDSDVLSQLVSAKEMAFLPTQYAYHRSLMRMVSVIGQPHLDKEELRVALNEVRKEQMRMEDAAMEISREALEKFSHEARRTVVRQFSVRW